MNDLSNELDVSFILLIILIIILGIGFELSLYISFGVPCLLYLIFWYWRIFICDYFN